MPAQATNSRVLPHGFEATLERARDLQSTAPTNPIYAGPIGQIILHRHIVANVRESAVYFGQLSNTFVSKVLVRLDIPHVMPLDGTFKLENHPSLFQAFRSFRGSQNHPNGSFTPERFIEKINVLTPDARNDEERFKIGKRFLSAVDITFDPGSLLTETPQPTNISWPIGPYDLIDFPQ